MKEEENQPFHFIVTDSQQSHTHTYNYAIKFIETMKIRILTQESDGENDTLELEVEEQWQVSRLKRRLEAELTSRPNPQSQRLIHGGKILADDDVLGRILNNLPEINTFHLVIRGESLRRRTNAQRQSNDNPAAPAAAPVTPAASPAAAAADDSPNYAQHFDAQMWARMLQQHQQLHNNDQGNNNPQQMWFNNAYAQYINQYMNYMQNAAVPLAAASTAAFIPPQQQHQQPVQPPAPAAAAAAAPAPVPAADGVAAVENIQPQNVGAGVAAGGALGGAMEDDDDLDNGGERDVLDYFYVFSRLLVLMSIVYFYSSFIRFVVVTGFGLIAYLYNTGYFRRQQQEPPGEDNNNNNQPEDINNNQEEPNNNVPEEQQQQEEEVVEGVPAEDVAVGNNNIFDTAATFITTFFSSLLPEQPQVA